MTANAFATISNVAEPKPKVPLEDIEAEEQLDYPPGARFTKEMSERVIGIIETECENLKVSQRAAAPYFHMRQPTLNRLLKQRAGVGLDVLLGLRLYFLERGKPRSLDDLLGVGSNDAMIAAYEALEARFAKLLEVTKLLDKSDDISKKKRQNLIAEVETGWRMTAGNRSLMKANRGKL